MPKLRAHDCTFVKFAAIRFFWNSARGVKVLTDLGKYLYAPDLSPEIQVAVRGMMVPQ